MLYLGLLIQICLVFCSALLQLRVLCDHLLSALEKCFVFSVHLDVSLGDLIIREYYTAVGDESVGIQHACKGLGQNRFSGSGLAYYGEGFVLVNVQGYIADSSKYPASYVEFYFHIFKRKQYLFFF